MLENLLSDTKAILSLVEEKTGCKVILTPDEVSYLSRTLLSARHRNGEPGQIVIAYNPKAHSIDYAIAHEAVRFMRFIDAPRDKRFMLGSSEGERSIAFGTMEKDIEGLPAEAQGHIRNGFDYFYDGILTQLVSTPGDFWINKLLLDNFPGFKPTLEEGAADIVERIHSSLSPKLERLTPKTIYKGFHAMNAAFTMFLDELMGPKDYSAPYRGSPFWEPGQALKSFNKTDRGHPGDTRTTNMWAEELGMRKWYRWVPSITR